MMQHVKDAIKDIGWLSAYLHDSEDMSPDADANISMEEARKLREAISVIIAAYEAAAQLATRLPDREALARAIHKHVCEMSDQQWDPYADPNHYDYAQADMTIEFLRSSGAATPVALKEAKTVDPYLQTR